MHIMYHFKLKLLLVFTLSSLCLNAFASGPSAEDISTKILMTMKSPEGEDYGCHYPTFGAFEDKFYEEVQKLEQAKVPRYVIEFGTAYGRISYKILSKPKKEDLHVIANDLVDLNLNNLKAVRLALLNHKSEVNQKRGQRLHIWTGG